MEARALILVAVGVVLVVVAAVGGLATPVAATFAGSGVIVLVLGVMLPLLEGRFKLPWLEGQLRERSQEVLEAARSNPDPEVAEAFQEAVRYLKGALGEARSAQEANRRAADLQDITERLNRLHSAPVSIRVRADKDPLTVAARKLDRH